MSLDAHHTVSLELFKKRDEMRPLGVNGPIGLRIVAKGNERVGDDRYGPRG